MFRELAVAFLIVAVCLVIHVISIVLLAERLVNQRERMEQKLGIRGYALLLIIVFSFIIILHVGETAIWAAFYYERGLFENYETSLYFSLTSFTTIGYGDVLLPQRWRLLGTIEGVSGVLLVGLSTAFIFAIVNTIFQIRLKRSET